MDGEFAAIAALADAANIAAQDDAMDGDVPVEPLAPLRQFCRDIVCLKVNKGIAYEHALEMIGVTARAFGQFLPRDIKSQLPTTWRQLLKLAKDEDHVMAVPKVLYVCPRKRKLRPDGTETNEKIHTYTSGHYLFPGGDDAETSEQSVPKCPVCNWVGLIVLLNLLTSKKTFFVCTNRNWTPGSARGYTCSHWRRGYKICCDVNR